MKIYFIVIFILTFGLTQLRAQNTSYYIPQSISNAYTDSTRSFDGKPGKNYWQNTVDYKIDLNIDPTTYTLSGYEEVVYYNKSNDKIHHLVIRLYADVFKKGNPRNSRLAEADLHDGVELKDLVINGDTIDLNNKKFVRRRNTNLDISLKKPLNANSELSLSLKWKQKIPVESHNRMGTYDSTNFFLGYWYPQLAVYDDIMGWDRLDYGLRTEFYNNLANFDVKITVPEKYIVVATGVLQNPKEIFPKQILKKFNAARESEEIIHVITKEDIEKGFHSKSNTWHYTASEVSDFAIAATNNYLWTGGMLPLNNHNVFISSIYPKTEKADYKKHISLQKEIILHFSNDIPGVPYPYPAFTSVITGGGYGGMEFPMMANNGSDYRELTIHEMFHTYFPMYVRTNERLWAWMDEGWAVFNTLMVENKYFKHKTKSTDFVNNGKYLRQMGRIADIPLMTPSEFTSSMNYGYLSYAYSATVKTILQHYLGEELFLKCYREFIIRWAKKSPTPYDFFFTFENISGEDLSWLLKPWCFEFGYADVDIDSFENGVLKLCKKGIKPVPVFVEIIYQNDSVKEIEYNAGIWKNYNNEFEIEIPEYKNVKAIFVNKTIADMNRDNNSYPKYKTITQLLEDNINKYGIDSALSIYSTWLVKNPKIYNGHKYNNSKNFDEIIRMLTESKRLNEVEKFKSFISKEFPLQTITIKVIPETLPKSGTIFIVGSGSELGNWGKEAKPLSQNDDGSWKINVKVEKHKDLRFIFTGGSWGSQFLNENGEKPDALIHTVKNDTTLTYDIYKWQDN